MALLSVNAMAQTLGRTVTFNVYLPSDNYDFEGKLAAQPPFKTLYLLHGILGNQNDWLVGTRVASIAKKYHLAVVMPSGDNRFYLNYPATNDNYSDFVGQELLDLTRRLFPLSQKREDTYIAGLSMGGYGALYNGLTFHDNFSAIGAFSAGLVTGDALNADEDSPIFFRTKSYLEAVFGDLEKVLDSDYHIPTLVKRLADEKIDLPTIFSTCGTEDSLITANRELSSVLDEQGINHTSIEKPGGHTWEYWNQALANFLEWLPIERVSGGVSSGNVGV
ncbi:alpha/beta hydrolase [Streptococcus pluranimalium]|uniref:alpha/beta hydrolase n=1 Tax=Streptococcus pluranimalium TaxID=82348 RepID=UPI003F690633